MKEKAGRVYSVAEENAPVPGCTISREISDGERYIGYFSLAEETDISAEIYDYHKLLIVAGGRLEVYFDGKTLFRRQFRYRAPVIYVSAPPQCAPENTCALRTPPAIRYSLLSIIKKPPKRAVF
ncbi:MAG: hypothetical protein ACI3VM_04410 [Oscillospiraceae bacterium]